MTTDKPTPMRCQATALMTLGERQMLEELAELHRTDMSVILRSGLHQFKENPDSQKAWIEVAKQVFLEGI